MTTRRSIATRSAIAIAMVAVSATIFAIPVAEARRGISVDNRGPTTGKSQPSPVPVVRDHRNGGARGGGVTVIDGKRRPPGRICAGWFC